MKKNKIIGAKVIKKEEDLMPILEKGIDAIPKEFNLKDERKQIRQEFIELYNELKGKFSIEDLKLIFQGIEQQDEEFIRRLKDEIYCCNDCKDNKFFEVIDKLAGEKLIK